MRLRDAIQRIALQMPAYGYRRVTAELRRRSWVVNHKRVLRLMRQDNLLCLRRRAFVRTTNSDHKLPIYPNLARDLTVSRMNQLWAADITYIRLQQEFVYLAVILDVFSRRVIGWALGRTLEAHLAIEALRMALEFSMRPKPTPSCSPDTSIRMMHQAWLDSAASGPNAQPITRRENTSRITAR